MSNVQRVSFWALGCFPNHKSPITAFWYFPLSILTNEPHVRHLSVTTGPFRTTVNASPPQGWGFRSRTVGEFEVCSLKFEVETLDIESVFLFFISCKTRKEAFQQYSNRELWIINFKPQTSNHKLQTKNRG